MAEIKAVIFDMDGVLIDAKEWHYEALNEALIVFGHEPISREDHLSTYDGLSTNQKLNTLGVRECEHQAINHHKQSLTMRIAESSLAPNPKHIRLMQALKKEGYKIAVASNSIRNTIEVFMDKAELSQYLDFFLSNEDVSKPKPDPEIYNLAISKLGLRPDECLIVEDNERGLIAARASGANVMEVFDVERVHLVSVSMRIGRLNGNI